MEFLDIMVMLIIFSGIAADEITKGPREFCSFEHFNATCAPDHVIVMVSARYGRMKLGRCVTVNLGYIGCAADVLPRLDQRCTGRRHCDFPVSDPELMKLQPCTRDVTAHLEVEYRCVPVLVPGSPGKCNYNDKPVLMNSTHYLSSMVAADTGYGSTHCPWQLTTRTGQTMTVSVYDTLLHTGPDGMDVCYTLGTVAEGQKVTQLTICPQEFKTSRFVVLFSSKTRQIELSFYSVKQQAPYLLQVNVEGCPNISLPQNTKSKTTQNGLLITCNNSEQTWALICRNNKWEGELGNCSNGSKGPWAMQHIFQDGNILPMGILIAVAMGVALGIFLGGLLLVIVGSRMKRRQRQRLQQAAMIDAPEYDISVEAPQRYPSKTPGAMTLSSGMEYTLSRGTDFTSGYNSERSHGYRGSSGRQRDQDTRSTTSPYHAYETPTVT